MKRFRYNLDALLSLRRQVEERCQIELADANRKLDAARERQGWIESTIRDALQARIRRPPTTAVALLDWDRYMGRQRAALEAQKAAVHAAAAEVERRRQALLAARVEVRKLEKHRERQRDAWTVEARRHEQRRLDEIGGLMNRWRTRTA